MSTIKSTELIRPFLLCWEIAGATKNKNHFRIPYIMYSVLIQIFVTLFYPFHLQMALFRFKTPSDNMKNLAVCITCTACSLKFLIYAWQIKKVFVIESLLDKLDERIKGTEEEKLFDKIRKMVRGNTLLVLGVYGAVGTSAALSFIFKTERGLLYPAWFPLNWHENTLYYALANLYQIIGIFYQLLQNYADDCISSVCLCILSGHTKLLALRVSKIGHKIDDLVENEEELLRCIHDQENLYSLFDVVQELISFPMFIQITVSAANICVAMAALIFYVDAPLDILYYAVYFSAMPLQIFPTCYFGSDIQQNFRDLHYAVFCSNWTAQSRTYKKHMMLFTERSLKETTAFAGGMVRIHLDTFFSTCRGAYSLFAVIMQVK